VDGSPLRVLIVDDDDALCSVLAYKLRKSGFEPLSMNDGLAAIEFLRTSSVDVLLLDVMMHKIDGYQVLRALSSGELNRPRASIVISARSAEEDILKAFQLGAVDYVTKPFSMNVLIARVRIALGLEQVDRAERELVGA
jgi:DNA-binding response OmpR family regulator